jgi:hypothetical protein
MKDEDSLGLVKAQVYYFIMTIAGHKSLRVIHQFDLRKQSTCQHQKTSHSDNKLLSNKKPNPNHP